MAGRYHQRFGFCTAGNSKIGLPLSEVTIADLLRKEGYATDSAAIREREREPYGRVRAGSRSPGRPACPPQAGAGRK